MGVVAPIVFTLLIFNDIETPSTLNPIDTQVLVYQLITPYLVMAGLLFLLVIFVQLSPLQEIVVKDEGSYDDMSVFHIPQVVFGMIALFFYVGIEVIAGDTIGLYAQKIGMHSATVLTSQKRVHC